MKPSVYLLIYLLYMCKTTRNEEMELPITKIPLNSRIIYGQFAESSENFSYQVSIRLMDYHICGGAIISKTCVLTAAHCFIDPGHTLNVMEYNIGYGNVNRQLHKVTKIRRIAIHNQFDEHSQDNDIAIVFTHGQFKFTNFVKPIKYDPTQELYDGMDCITSGWGTILYGLESPNLPLVLKYAHVPIYNNQECKKLRPYRNHITDHMICAGGSTGDACQGDSGGPLICNDVLVGIISFGAGCGKFPGVYTGLHSYGKWIERTSSSSNNLQQCNTQYVIKLILFVRIYDYLIYI